MEQLKNAIQDTMNLIEETTTLFYQQKTQDGFSRLDSTLSSLMQTLTQILEYQTGKAERLIDDTVLNTVLTEAMKAMEQKDTILLSDLLIYEVNQILEDCLNQI